MNQLKRSDAAATPSAGGQPPVPPMLWAACRLISGLAAFSFAPLIGWNWGGWGGLALGFAVAVPLAFVLHYPLIVVGVVLQVGIGLSFGVIVLVVMGSLWVFNRRQFDIIQSELSQPLPGRLVESAVPVAPSGPIPGPGSSSA